MADQIDHIEELEKRLYARDPESIPKRKFGILRPTKQSATSTWGQTQLPRDKTPIRTNISGYKRFFFFSVLFFAFALSVALYSMYRGAMTLSSKNVTVTILGNSFVGGGEELPIQVEIANKNSADLVDAELTIDYPKGATDQAGGDIVHIKKTLGTIASGKTKSEVFTVVLYGEQGISRDIKATLSYKLNGSIAIFQKEQLFSVMVSSSPLALTVDGPPAVGSNQPFGLTIRNTFSGDTSLDNAVVRIEYPNGYLFQSAVPAPVSGNNVWSLGDLEKGTERAIFIKGKLVGEEQDEKSFRIYVGARQSDMDNRIAVAYNSALHTVIISQPFITGTIAVNGQEGDIIALPVDAPINGVVRWVNNSPVSVVNPVFTLALNGDSVDTESLVIKDGYYNALDRTVTWTAESDPTLATLSPGQRGEFAFGFKTKPVIGTQTDINLGLSVKGTFPEREYQESSISNIDAKTIRFAARLQFAAQSLYSIGAIKNTGPFPPKADQETTYTISWTAKPVENALTQMQASAVLPVGVIWGGVIVPQTEQVAYNPETRIVTWILGVLPKATSIPASKTVSFQVKVRPTRTQVDSELTLLGTTTITATDTVANAPLTLSRPPLTTKLDTDPAYIPGKEKVVR